MQQHPPQKESATVQGQFQPPCPCHPACTPGHTPWSGILAKKPLLTIFDSPNLSSLRGGCCITKLIFSLVMAMASAAPSSTNSISPKMRTQQDRTPKSSPQPCAPLKEHARSSHHSFCRNLPLPLEAYCSPSPHKLPLQCSAPHGSHRVAPSPITL